MTRGFHDFLNVQDARSIPRHLNFPTIVRVDRQLAFTIECEDGGCEANGSPRADCKQRMRMNDDGSDEPRTDGRGDRAPGDT